jgi:hypothetical protein
LCKSLPYYYVLRGTAKENWKWLDKNPSYEHQHELRAGEPDHGDQVFGMEFAAHEQSWQALQPGDQPLHEFACDLAGDKRSAWGDQA